LEKLSAFEDVKILLDRGGTIASGRNVGIRHAKGEIVAITDGDMTVDQNWLSEIAREFKHPDVGAVGGPILTNPKSSKFSHVVGLLPEESLNMVSQGPVPHDMIYTRNIAYLRSALAEVGLFNESLVAAEDPELNWRIENAGYRLIFSPRVLVYHSHRSSFPSYVKQHFRNGVGCGQVMKINTKIRHTGRKLLSAVGLASGICLLIALALSRLSTMLYPVVAMVIAYLSYGVNHIRSVYTKSRSVRTTIAALILTLTWPPFWGFGLLWGLTKSTNPVLKADP